MTSNPKLTSNPSLISNPKPTKILGPTTKPLSSPRAKNAARYRDWRFDADGWTTGVYVRREGKWRCV